MTTQQPKPVRTPGTREEEADLALRNTAVTPVNAWCLIAGFFLLIAAVPVLELASAARRSPGTAPAPLRIASLLPPLQAIASARTPVAFLDLLPKEQAIRTYEHTVENSSILSDWVLPPMQAALSRWGVGNEKAYCGVRGWLFYRPDVDYVTGPGFLDAAFLLGRRRKSEGRSVQPDPIPAILRFNRELKQRGITLVVMPIPSKVIVEPGMLNPRFSGRSDALQNPSFARFCEVLRGAGVILFDPTPVLLNARRTTNLPQFLRTDTHWTPDAMESVAFSLAGFLRSNGLVAGETHRSYRRRSTSVENLGDIAMMLKLPAHQTLYTAQRVTVHQVCAADGAPWRPRKSADVLLMGDSYTTIYSLDGMGWGSGGGLAEQISVDLGRPLDRIAINDGGSYTTREELVRDAARGRDRLRGKRLVIWEFAMRDLIEGDWRLLDIPAETVTAPAAAGHLK